MDREENPWVEYDYGDGGKIWQRRCTSECENGLLLGPVRFCDQCSGSGYEVTFTRPNSV